MELRDYQKQAKEDAEKSMRKVVIIGPSSVPSIPWKTLLAEMEVQVITIDEVAPLSMQPFRPTFPKTNLPKLNKPHYKNVRKNFRGRNR